MRFSADDPQSQSDAATHPSISVGVRTRKQGMENDDGFIQVPDENPLQRMRVCVGGERVVEDTKKNREKKRQNQWCTLSGLQGDPPGQ